MKKIVLLVVVLSALNNLKAQSVMSEAYHKSGTTHYKCR